MTKRGIIAIFVFAFLFLALPLSLAASVSNNLPVQIQSTNDNGNIVTGTFNYTVNISNSASNTCDSSNIVYSNETTKTTDNRGIVSYQLKDVNLDFDEQYWFCYYREGNLEDTVKMGSTPYAFSADGLQTSEGFIQNVSDINGSDITNDLNWINSSQVGSSSYWNRSSGNLYPDDLSDNVGIGTSSPTAKLDVQGGNINLNSNNALQFDETDILRVNLSNNSVAVGDSNVDVSKNRITAVGAQAGEGAGNNFAAQGYSAGYQAGNSFAAQGPFAGRGAGTRFAAQGLSAGLQAGDDFAAQGLFAGYQAGDDFAAQGYLAGRGAGNRFAALGYESTRTDLLSTPTGISDSVAIGYQSAPRYDGHFVLQQANLGDGSPILQGDMDTDKLGVDFSNDATLSDTFNVKGTANFTGNVTSQTDFCIEGGKCLSGVAVEDTNLSGISPSSNSLSNSFPDISVNWNDATDLTTNGDLGSSTVSDSELSVNVEGISTGLSSGSIAFSDGSTLSGENSNLYWDSSNDRLGIGTSSPSSNLDVDGSAQFGGTWENGGAEIQDGDVYAQTGYFYNISSLNVSTLSVNGSQIPQLDDTFVLGNSTNRWKSANVGTGGINSTGTIRQGGNQVLDTSDQKWNRSSGNVYLDDLSDNIGIGTDSPGSDDLRVYDDDGSTTVGLQAGSSQGQANILEFRTSNGIALGGLDNQGRFGIGTPNPVDTLNVKGTGNITGNVTSQTDFCIEGGNCLSGVAVEDTNLSGISPSSNSLSNSFPDIAVNWNDATDLTTNGDLGSSTVSDSELSVNVEGISTGLSSGSIAFSDGSTLSGENLNLHWDSSNDRLGISSVNPQSRLQINGDVNGSEMRFDTLLEESASIEFASGGTVYSRIVEDSNQDMVFETNNNGVSDNKDFIWNDSESRVMTLRGEGMLGIGTHVPEEELEVIGRINASEDICISGGNCLSSVSGGGGFDGVNSNYLFNNSGNIDFNETYLDNNVEWTSSGSEIYPNNLSKGVGVRTDSLSSQAFAVNTSGTQEGVSLGKNLNPSGKHSLSTGKLSESSGANSLATGYDNYASGFASFAGGRFTEVSGDDSFGYGDGVKVDGLDSFATGLNSSAAGNRAFAAGSFANASGRTSVALGSTTVASATNSVALGGGTASGIGSFVSGGPLTEASGQNSFALGEEVDAKGKNSFALGNGIVSSGNYSFAIGLSGSMNPHPDINQSNTMAVMGGRLSVDQTLPYSRFDVNGSVSKEIRRPRDTQTIYIGNYDTYALRVSAQSISRAVILPPPDRAEDREYAIIRTDAATSGNNINVDVPEEFGYSINGGPIELERAYSSVKLMADEKTDKWYIVSSYRYP